MYYRDNKLNYRDSKFFQNENFRKHLLFKLSKLDAENSFVGFTDFIEIDMKIVNQHPSCKQKPARGSYLPFTIKIL